MFKPSDNFQYKYAPILSLSPAEMTALEELPDKDKDFILPIIPLKGWLGSIKIDDSMQRIEAAIKKRCWIADIDRSFIARRRVRPPPAAPEEEAASPRRASRAKSPVMTTVFLSERSGSTECGDAVGEESAT